MWMLCHLGWHASNRCQDGLRHGPCKQPRDLAQQGLRRVQRVHDSDEDKRVPLVAQAAIYLVGVIVIGALALWILPAVLSRHPSHGMTAAQTLMTVNDVRTVLVAFVVAAGAAGTLWFTGRSYALNREGHVTDRYTKAVGQLGDKSSPVRVGGVYALERIGHDSAKDRTTIIYVLGAFIRERSRDPEREERPPEDLLAGIRVAGRLLQRTDNVLLDLTEADLRNTDLSRLPRDRVILERAKLEGAKLPQQPS